MKRALLLLITIAMPAVALAYEWRLIKATRVDGPTPGWACTYEKGLSRITQFQTHYCTSTPL